VRLRARPALLTVVAALVACSDGGPPVLRFQAVSAGAAHSCALETSGRAWCWGQNGTGALGTGDTAQHREPALVTGFAFTMLAAGFLHSCGLRDDGAAFCWGINGLGELGDGSRQDRWSPVAVAGGLRFVQISAGEGATCGITASDSGLYCWGTDLIGLNAPAGRDSTRPALANSLRWCDIVACLTGKHPQSL